MLDWSADILAEIRPKAARRLDSLRPEVFVGESAGLGLVEGSSFVMFRPGGQPYMLLPCFHGTMPPIGEALLLDMVPLLSG